MLETEEVDEDYFTPVSSSSLANIFGKTVTNEVTENKSLKYTPPKQHGDQKSEDSKTTTCIFACALVGYEWSNNAYTSKGKLGFAIIKVIKNDYHNMVLYDANKTTLSHTLISPKLKINLKNGNFISYYDNLHKCWSLYGSEEDINKIVQLLKTLNVTLSEQSSQPDSQISQPETIRETNVPSTVQDYKNEVGSDDTDSSVNRKTKASILNRMANMGHSVLPPHVPIEKSSDSSDDDEATSKNYTVSKPVRHKSVKSVVKKNIPDKILSQDLYNTEPTKKTVTPEPIENISTYKYNNEQLIPMPSTSIVTSTNIGNSDMSFFMSEQRIANSELRINMNRITDRIDQVLDKINNIDHKPDNNLPHNIQTQILQKLLTEYENKIKFYEETLKSKGLLNTISTTEHSTSTDISSLTKQNDDLHNKIRELEKVIKEKNSEISMLQDETKRLKENLKQHENDDHLLRRVTELEQELSRKSDELISVTNKFESISLQKPDKDVDISDKVKNIMNDTFRAIAANFDNSETYSGDTIKHLVAVVIKKVTVDSLSVM